MGKIHKLNRVQPNVILFTCHPNLFSKTYLTKSMEFIYEYIIDPTPTEALYYTILWIIKSYGKMSEGKIKCIYSSHIFPQHDMSSENNTKHFMPSVLVRDTFTMHVNVEYSFLSYTQLAYSSKHLNRVIYKTRQPLILGSLSSTPWALFYLWETELVHHAVIHSFIQIKCYYKALFLYSSEQIFMR